MLDVDFSRMPYISLRKFLYIPGLLEVFIMDNFILILSNDFLIPFDMIIYGFCFLVCWYGELHSLTF